MQLLSRVAKTNECVKVTTGKGCRALDNRTKISIYCTKPMDSALRTHSDWLLKLGMVWGLSPCEGRRQNGFFFSYHGNRRNF